MKLQQHSQAQLDIDIERQESTLLNNGYKVSAMCVSGGSDLERLKV
jgi:hypothetical protein